MVDVAGNEHHENTSSSRSSHTDRWPVPEHQHRPNTVSRASLVVASLAVVGALLLPTANAAGPGSEPLCESARFLSAFEEGRAGGCPVGKTVSRRLVELSDEAVPCLSLIARDNGSALKIPSCRKDPDVESCRMWAMRGLVAIRTAGAKSSLVRLLDLGWTGRRLQGLLGALVAIHPPESRPALLALLESPDPRTRSWALLAVGALGNGGDFDAMVRCAKRLPVEELNRAARAFEFLGDPRAITVLRDLAAPLPESSRGEIDGSIARLERGEPIRPE